MAHDAININEELRELIDEDWEEGDKGGISTLWINCPKCGIEQEVTYNAEIPEPDFTIVKIVKCED